MGAQSHKTLLLVLAGLLLLSVLSGCGPEYPTEEQARKPLFKNGLKLEE